MSGLTGVPAALPEGEPSAAAPPVEGGEIDIPAQTNPTALIYLDNYLETVGFLPQEIQRLLNTLKDMDARTQELARDVKHRTEECLRMPPLTSRNNTDEQKAKIVELQKEVEGIHGVLDLLSNEKVEVAKKALEMLDGHITELDVDLIKFEEEITLTNAKAELEELHQQQSQREKASLVSPGTLRNADQEIKQGDQVSARISAPGAPDEWILARVMNVSDDQFTFTILDEDAEEGGTSSIHHLPRRQIIKLPSAKEKRQKVLGERQTVLAMFPNTTVFYTCVVVQTARWQPKNSCWGNYLLAFEDDEDVNNPGFQAHRSVAFQHVLPPPL